jgi:3',5'-cyclic AMP phosphodiesterase CpdA
MIARLAGLRRWGIVVPVQTRHCVIQISDVHIEAAGPKWSGIDQLANLERTLALIEASAVRPEALILTGDLVNSGDAPSYRLLRERVQPFAELLGARVVYLPGNHDERAVFRQCLLDAQPSGDPIDQVAWLGGLRIVALDTTVPGEEHGALSDQQLSWLESELAAPAPDGTIVALHHPPVSSPIASMAAIALEAPQRLHRVVDGTDVTLIIAGHNHHASCGMLGSVPVWVGPASAYQADVMSEAEFRRLAGCAFTRIDVADGRALATVVPVALASPATGG